MKSKKEVLDQYLPGGQSCGGQKVKNKEMCTLQSHLWWTWVSIIIRSVLMGEKVSELGDRSSKVGVRARTGREVEEFEKFQVGKFTFTKNTLTFCLWSGFHPEVFKLNFEKIDKKTNYCIFCPTAIT